MITQWFLCQARCETIVLGMIYKFIIFLQVLPNGLCLVKIGL